MNTPSDNNTQPIRKRRRNCRNRPLRINHRHRYMVELYVLAGLTDITRCVLDAGLAVDPADATVMGRNYLARPEIITLIREELQRAGLTEARIKNAVIRWIDSDDPNASLRASELGARLLGLLREPAPAVPQLPPLIVVQAQAALPEATDGAALDADYTVEPAVVEAAKPLIDVQASGHQADVATRPPKRPPKARKATSRHGTRKAKDKAAE